MPKPETQRHAVSGWTISMNNAETSIRERIEEHGFATVPDVLTRETVDKMISGIQSALNRAGTSALGGHE